ncbi:hypothetical protein [Rhizobium bangladeshense]|uniref:hypothetical protein n=1 Tax=Rhizobium bangladeshense TaxID=1138189 RepID=UPI000AB7E8E2|nr:hypothetical protein [Rhizobium bangladeshense]
MRLMIICVLGAAVFAAPCIYDMSSREPSPLVGLVTATSAVSSAQAAVHPRP